MQRRLRGFCGFLPPSVFLVVRTVEDASVAWCIRAKRVHRTSSQDVRLPLD